MLGLNLCSHDYQQAMMEPAEHHLNWELISLLSYLGKQTSTEHRDTGQLVHTSDVIQFTGFSMIGHLLVILILDKPVIHVSHCILKQSNALGIRGGIALLASKLLEIPVFLGLFEMLKFSVLH